MSFPVTAVLVAGLSGLVLATLLGGIAARLGFPVPDESRRLGAIDGLRGYLALLVMVHHFAIYLLLAAQGGGWRDVDVLALGNFGAGSVTLFFMITGALFFPKTWSGIGGNGWRSMYVSRAFRILPLQAVTVAIIAVVALVRVRWAVGDSWISFPARFALWLTSYSQPMLFGYRGTAQVNAFVLWSLWAEWTFYFLALPLIALTMGLAGARRGRWLIPIMLFAAGIACRHSDVAALRKLDFSIFACGMLALLIRSGRLAPALRTWPATLIAGPGLVLNVATLPPDHPLAIVSYTLFFACVICGNRFAGLLGTRGALVLGEASFSIYMLHGVLLNVVFVSGSDIVASIPAAARPWLLVALIPAMSGLALATYLLVERPAIGIGRRLAKRWGRSARTKVEVSSVVAAP